MEPKSKKITGDGGTSSAIPSTASAASHLRDWPDLPQDLLIQIFNRLAFSIPDRLSFADVCPSFHSAAASAASSTPFSGPPLLFHPLGYSLIPLTNLRFYRSPLRSKFHTPVGDCIGSSFGRLIFDAGDKTITLANVFSGREIELTHPYPHRFRPRIGILTAPPSASSSSLVLVGPSFTLCCRLNGEEWVKEGGLRYGAQIISVALANGGGLVCCLGYDYKVKVVDFGGPVSWRTIETVAVPVSPSRLHGNLTRFLVRRGEELLLVLFVRTRKNKFRIDVYRLDSEEERWVKEEDLGDWCLFIDAASNSQIACSNPAIWGGSRNCIYVVGPGYNTFSVFPLDGLEIEIIDDESPLCSALKKLAVWPSPVWIYPNMFS